MANITCHTSDTKGKTSEKKEKKTEEEKYRPAPELKSFVCAVLLVT